MGLQRVMITTVLGVVALVTHARAELNECLGVEMSRLHALPTCTMLYTACEVGVQKLNKQLHVTAAQQFSPVSVVSASESRVNDSKSTLVAMLVQLAPIDECVDAPSASGSVAQTSCSFDMTKLEVYSLLVTLDKTMRWSLDGYQHHALTDNERARIVQQYRAGKFFGSNLALGIFDSPSLPLESATTAQDKPLVRSSAGVLFVLASAGLSIGLLFHHRRRLSNGYAPIVVLKRGQLQATKKPPSAPVSRSLAPERSALRQANPVPTHEDTVIKHEQNERFAV